MGERKINEERSIRDKIFLSTDISLIVGVIKALFFDELYCNTFMIVVQVSSLFCMYYWLHKVYSGLIT